MDAGADICVTSIHKMGNGLEQGSVFHLRGELIDPAELASRADLLGTTSPNVLPYASIDAVRTTGRPTVMQTAPVGLPVR
jgi:lysine decarboxylase